MGFGGNVGAADKSLTSYLLPLTSKKLQLWTRN